MKPSTRLIATVCALALAGSAMFMLHAADARRHSSRGNELWYLPNEKLLNHFTGGLDTVIADLLWLRCVQYVAAENKGERSFIWLNKMLDTVVRLDPYFRDVYRYGGVFLTALKADSGAGLDLLERGMVRRPGAWELPYEAAMVFLLNRAGQPDSKRRAAYYLGMSAATAQAPEFITTLAAKLQGEYNLTDIERDMWSKMLRGGDTLLRDLAQRKLQELDLRETCRILNERLGQYKQTTGKMPESLVELGLKPEALTDPLGGRFFTDADGVIKNTSVLDSVETQHRNLIRAALDRYQRERGAWPASLGELVKSGIMAPIPAMPYASRQWIYDPATGSIK